MIAVAIVLLGFLIALLYAFATPPLQAPDESSYYTSIRIVATEYRLPDVSESTAAGHPPLYLLLGAIVFKLCGSLAIPGKVLALRVMGAFFFGAAVWMVWLLARLLMPDRPQAAVLSAMVAALWPQLAFISASVSSDALLFFLGAATINCGLKALTRLSPGYLCLTTVMASAGFMTKQRFVFILIPVVLIYLFSLPRLLSGVSLSNRLRWAMLIPAGALMALLFMFTSGIAQAAIAKVPAVSRAGLIDATALSWEFQNRMFEQTWGYFGKIQIPLPGWSYAVFAGICLMSCIGIMVFYTRRERGHRLTAIFISSSIIALLLMFAAMADYESNGAGAQGRYVLTLFAPIAVLMAIGLSEVFKGRYFKHLLVILGSTMLFINLYGVFFCVIPFSY